MKIAICDDDRLEKNLIENTVQEFVILKQPVRQVNVHTFTNGEDLLLYIQKHGVFDLFILDIILPGLNGIELAAEIRKMSTSCKIIFLTNSPEFAVESYKVGAFYYLLKNYQKSELLSLLNKALEEISREDVGSIVLKEKGKLTRVQKNTIQYIESMNHTVCFHLRNHQSISCFSTMNEYQAVLLSDKRFIRCHKSFIVNMDYVTSISNMDFILEGDVLVRISRKDYQRVKDDYLDYFFNKGNGLQL